jgi:hypothetical protein
MPGFDKIWLPALQLDSPRSEKNLKKEGLKEFQGSLPPWQKKGPPAL